MSITSTVTTRARALPRQVVGTYLQIGRVPLGVAARAAHQEGNEAWPPAVAYEAVGSKVEALLGSLLHDDELAQRGRLRQAKVTQLKRAADLATLAEQERAQADARLEQQEEQIEERAEAAEERAEERERQLQQQAEAAERAAAKKAAADKAKANKAKAAQDKAAARLERQAKAESLAAEERALAETQAALDAERTAGDVEAELQQARASS